MAVPTDAPMPQNMQLPDGYIVQFAALNPATGVAIAGVTVSNVSIFGTLIGTGTGGVFSTGAPILLRQAK